MIGISIYFFWFITGFLSTNLNLYFVFSKFASSRLESIPLDSNSLSKVCIFNLAFSFTLSLNTLFVIQYAEATTVLATKLDIHWPNKAFLSSC